ncbi:MAG: TIGR01777 family oxidoreductase [Siphonobacter aquaeclarae]|nr:TIGR01777 family oxidoreductase [Siphonobacter aquaeclarae]
MKQVLFTGGTGLVGLRLTEWLLGKGYQVACLTRGSRSESRLHPDVKTYTWDIRKGELDETALEESHYLVHLAGAPVADKRWTPERRKEILESRVGTLDLITDRLTLRGLAFEAVISASGISYYGEDTGDELLTEEHPLGKGFLAEVSRQWEEAVDRIGGLGIRTVKLRTGLVLSREGGALPAFLAPVRWGVGSPLGTGKQYQSWIHLDDLCRMYADAIENPWSGAYNAVGPQPVTNEELIRTIAQVLRKPFWAPNVPVWALRLLLGERASLVAGGNRVDNQRIRKETGFQYLHTDLRPALEALLIDR